MSAMRRDDLAKNQKLERSELRARGWGRGAGYRNGGLECYRKAWDIDGLYEITYNHLGCDNDHRCQAFR